MSHTSRRTFARTLAVAGVALPLAAPSAASDPRLAVVRGQYGQHLDENELRRIDTALQDNAKLIEQLRAFKLVNSDEPDFTFSALTDRW